MKVRVVGGVISDFYGHMAWYLNQRTSDVYIVTDIEAYNDAVPPVKVGSYAGIAWTNGPVFITSFRLNGLTLPHELGHVYDLDDHDQTGTLDWVMYWSTGGAGNELTRSHALAYE